MGMRRRGWHQLGLQGVSIAGLTSPPALPSHEWDLLSGERKTVCPFCLLAAIVVIGSGGTCSFICSSIRSFWSEYVLWALSRTLTCILVGKALFVSSQQVTSPLHLGCIPGLWEHSVTQWDTAQSEPAVEKDAFPDLCVSGWGQQSCVVCGLSGWEYHHHTSLSPLGPCFPSEKPLTPFFSVSEVLRSSKWQSISTLPCWKSPSLNPFWDKLPKTNYVKVHKS